MADKKRVRDALGEEHEGKKDGFLLDPDKLVLVEDRGSALFDARALSEADERFVLNIMAIGVHTPIVVRKNTETGEIEVVAGRRRTLACREANRRLKKQGLEPRRIPATVTRGDAASLMGIMISENEIRLADSPMNRARKMAAYIELGRSEQDAAVLFGVSAATVGNTLRLLEAPVSVRKAVESGAVSVSDGYKLARLKPAEAAEKVEQLKVEAPRTGKRSKNSKRAREIVGGKKRKLAVDVHSHVAQFKQDVQEMLSQIETDERINENKRMGAVAALRWVLGDEKSLGEIMDLPEVVNG